MQARWISVVMCDYISVCPYTSTCIHFNTFSCNSYGVTRRCNALVRIIRHLGKVYKSFIMPHSYCIRYKHFTLFTHGMVKAQSECPASRQAGFYRGVSTTSSSAIGYTYTRGTRYAHADRVLLTFVIY